MVKKDSKPTAWEQLSPEKQKSALGALDSQAGTKFAFGMEALGGNEEAKKILISRTKLLIEQQRLKPAGKK